MAVKRESTPRDPRFALPALILGLVGLAVMIASLTVFKESTNDIWIHLKTGEIILDTWQIPSTDPYSFTASDHDYIAHEWLAGVLFHLVYVMAGVNGVIFLKAAVIFATCAALFGACTHRRDRLVVLFPCFTLMAFIGSARFLGRPHIFSYLFTALYLFCYFGYRDGGRSRAWLYAIPPLHILWTNLHGGHYQGLFLLVMLAAAEVVMAVRARSFGLATEDAIAPRDVGLVCALPLVSWLAGLINPYGIRLLTFPFELTGQEIFMKGIYEWQPAIYPSYSISSMFLYYIIWIAVLFGTFFLVRKHAGLSRSLREAAVVANAALILVWALFVFMLSRVYATQDFQSFLNLSPLWYGAIALFLIANFHRLDFHHAGIVALFFAMSMRHNRAVTDAAVATLPTLSHNINRVLDRFGPARARARVLAHPALLAGMGAAMLGLGIFTFWDSYYFSFNPSTKREMGLGVAGNMPSGAVDYIERTGITGNCFTSYNAAAMLIHRMWPDVKVSMDSRNDVYGEALYAEYRDASSDRDLFEAYLSRWPVDFFLINYRGVSGFLDQMPEWVLVYFDDSFLVYVKDSPMFADIVQRDGYRLIKPSLAQSGALKVQPEEVDRWILEADRAIAASPEYSWFPLHIKAKALLVAQRPVEAEEALVEVVRLSPDHFYAWFDLGMARRLRGDMGGAREAFTRCLETKPDFSPCRTYMNQPN